MDIFQVLSMLGGLSLFLFGMSVMGQALERRAGEGLRDILGRLTTGKLAGLLTGLGVTAVIQSSSAATVMVVGFVNSGLMTLRQAIHVIMGANIGTTVTAWVLSLAGIESGNIFVRLLKPSSFTPVLAVIGVIFYMFCKSSKKRDTGAVLLGFATLMTGMETMSGAVSGLGEVPAFRELFLLFQNPLLGMLAGALLTAVIQSSSASVGILQALAATGQVTYGAAVPIIMGQNIGTCVTALLSAVGAGKNARRAALVHLSFNVIGAVSWLSVFWIIKLLMPPAVLGEPASLLGIAVCHSVFNLLCTLLLLPMTGWLERLVCRLIRDGEEAKPQPELDERLFATPSIALESCRNLAGELARNAAGALREGLASMYGCTPALEKSVLEREALTDRYEDMLGTYLVRLSARRVSAGDSAQAAKLLKAIGDFERIADHGVNLLESAMELRDKGLSLSPAARNEYDVIASAVEEILGDALKAFLEDDLEAAGRVEPLEQVIDGLKEQLRTNHILRLQGGECSIEGGFVWSDILTNIERVSDHCSNIAGCVIDIAQNNMNIHASLRDARNEGGSFKSQFIGYKEKYSLQ
ncbi:MULTISPECIES: Na/Pi cotransporter family protein [unclassified Acutalibacter]|jgi:phosphate:Na+ symporter|uniref:Na/Pi cotransporter family protein n=1 Tax=unclassified Acutalibacter TaxID=2620728 RepID=UPI001413604D|nr:MULTISPECIES: Na/Pi cotransporter family protein [unclassified Acutalibacter]MCI9225358.1 Na/Pi cotransporter family protein [Acutalibacter sp.]NBJ89377.1 Na/Pi cotransporter family protein [Acutalibacter sp. 1XD8-36]